MVKKLSAFLFKSSRLFDDIEYGQEMIDPETSPLQTEDEIIDDLLAEDLSLHYHDFAMTFPWPQFVTQGEIQKNKFFEHISEQI